MSDDRERKRQWYYRNREKVLAQQRDYQESRREMDPEYAGNRTQNHSQWRQRFKAAMLAEGFPGRDGQGLSPETYYQWEKAGIEVPPWPDLKEPKKSHGKRRKEPYDD